MCSVPNIQEGTTPVIGKGRPACRIPFQLLHAMQAISDNHYPYHRNNDMHQYTSPPWWRRLLIGCRMTVPVVDQNSTERYCAAISPMTWVDKEIADAS